MALIVKKAAKAAGLATDAVSGHSLRAGHVTAAAKGHKSIASIMTVTAYRSQAMVRHYHRRASLFDDAGGIGL